MGFQYYLSAIAIGLTLFAFFPYIQSIRNGQTKPHVFSWVIWGSSTFVVFLAQLAGKGGAGAWPIGVSGLITIYVACLAYTKKTDNQITSIDWFFFISAMSSLPFWYLTSDPLWAVVILTAVDLLGFGPTFKKAYARPDEEQLLFFVLITLRNVVSIAALQHFSLTTTLFPATLSVAGVIFILMVLYRRRVMEAVVKR
ncbi:MAG: hypothetical protein G3M70_09810 [Candidatus Nitronauta litoralis]|uniref:Uncharacterized protein n=1 Tax=Candidatus Nitronauta litoralis TaxID=2705533 RepID=A0A7T0G0P6_9BACT|nr:MAG: hypothetical protein G3M70_09810 [Candidatus Nitronauta litoralis]